MVSPSDCRSLNVTSSTVYRILLLALGWPCGTAASLTPAVYEAEGACVDGSNRMAASSGVNVDVVTLLLLLLVPRWSRWNRISRATRGAGADDTRAITSSNRDSRLPMFASLWKTRDNPLIEIRMSPACTCFVRELPLTNA